jgi:soluble lytic murein transglycosylase-like protein
MDMIKNTSNLIIFKETKPAQYKYYDRNKANVFAVNLIEAIKEQQTSNAISSNGHYYRVKNGDTLINIVRNYVKNLNIKNLNVLKLVKQVAKDNGISNPDLIFEGQNLDISALVALRRQSRTETDIENLSQSHLKDISYRDSFNLLKLIHEVSLSQGVNPYISIAIARAESGISASNDKKVSLNPYAVNRDSKSKGMFQLIDSSGKRFHRMLRLEGEYNPFNIKQNVKIGISYLKYLDNVFAKDTILADNLRTIAVLNPIERKYFSIAAFNSGEGRVAEAQQLAEKEGKDPRIFKNIEKYLPTQTRIYVSKVKKFVEMQNNT